MQPGPPLTRLVDLLQQPSTEIDSDIALSNEELQKLPKEDWTISGVTISAKAKRSSFTLPESHWKVRSPLYVKFSAKSFTNRDMSVIAQNKQIALFHLTPQWADYEVRVSPGDLKRPTLRQLVFLFNGNQEASYGDFRKLRLSVFAWNRLKLNKEARLAIVVQPSSQMKFSVILPAQKPTLFFGVGAQTPEDSQQIEAGYRVTLRTGSKEKEIIRKTFQTSPKSSYWSDQAVDLSEFAGRKVDLEFQSEPTDKNAVYRFAWSSPEIYDISSKAKKPNIILVSIDTLRHDRLIPQKMPNLAALAGRSIVYNDAYCTFPGTLPSHTSVMTGLYVAEHQVGRPGMDVARTNLIPHELTTVAQVALQQGYFTGGITDGGFVSGFYGFDQGFQQYIENEDKSRDRISTIENGLTWVKKNAHRPFFLFLHSYAVHEPFTPPIDLFRKLFPNPALTQEPTVRMEWLLKVNEGKIIPTEKEKEFVRQTYDAECYFYDQNFGRLLQELKQLKLDQNTVILIFGDHGELFFDYGNGFGHAKTLMKEEIQVPLILYIPGKGHEERNEIVSLADVFPTLAQLMGSSDTYDIDGMSLLEPSNAKRRFNRAIYYEVTYGKEARWGVQTNEFKFVVDKEKKQEYFYDLRKDPGERTNLSAQSPKAMQLMKNLLSAYIQKSIRPTEQVKASQEKQESGELREQLKALGYLN